MTHENLGVFNCVDDSLSCKIVEDQFCIRPLRFLFVLNFLAPWNHKNIILPLFVTCGLDFEPSDKLDVLKERLLLNWYFVKFHDKVMNLFVFDCENFEYVLHITMRMKWRDT